MPSLPPSLPPELARSAGQLATADGRSIQLVEGAPAGRALLDVLKPGEVVTARVVERFAAGSYLFTLRGRNLVAESRTPLARDSVARFQVLQTGQGIGLRLLDAVARDQAATSPPSGQLAQLGLPDTPAGRLVLQGFIDLQAPLRPATVQAAHQAVAADGDTATATRLVHAHALLARAGLPATPALLGLAERAQVGGLPNTGAELGRLLAQLTSAAPTGSGRPTAAGQATPASPTGPAQAAAPTLLPGQTSPPPAGAMTPAPATLGPANPGNPLGAPSIGGPGLGQPAPTAGTGPQPGSLPTPLGAELPPAASRVAALLAPLSEPTAQHFSQLLTDQGLRSVEAGAAHGAATDEAPARQAVQDLIHLLRQLAPDQSTAPGREALTSFAREQLADALLPPPSLQDYDLVLPLALPGAPQPPPARMAISRQRSGSGEEAVFLRVDVELTRLGPLSLRLSSLADGLLTIVLLATGRGLTALQAELPELEADLQEQGIETRIRLGDLIDDQAGGRRHG